MKKMTFFSLVAATVLFTACGEETKKEVAEATAAITEEVKEDSANALEATKEKASEVAEATKEKAEELTEAAADKTAEAATAVKEKAEEVAQGTAPAAYDSCKGCHGADGKTKALGKSAVIAGQDKAALIASMNEYKAGTRDVAGMGMLMKGQVANMSDADIEAVAEYLSSIK